MRLCRVKELPQDDRELADEARNKLSEYIRLPECKRLVSRILAAQYENDIKSVVVLSQFGGEGKTILIAALALGYMQLLNKRVLILDTVSQSRDESFYYRQVLGRASLKSGESGVKSGCIDLIATRNFNADSLRLDGNAQNPAVYQGSNQYDSVDFQVAPFVDSLKKDYDLILLDTCALREVTRDSFDPLILAIYADASIVVASRDSLDRSTIGALTQELKRHRVTPLGFVVNSGMSL